MIQKTSTSPTRSRDKVLQSLYEIEVGGSSLKEVLKDQFTKKNYPHYKALLEGVVESQEKIDELLESNMDRALSDLDPIERNVLRLAVYELLTNDLDKPIVINESIRLTKKYGAAEGYKYVNALIDKIAKEVFQDMWGSDKTADQVIEEKGLQQISDVGELESIVEKVIADNPKQVEQYLSGKNKVFGFFVGNVMKLTKGKANPAQVNELLKKKLI